MALTAFTSRLGSSQGRIPQGSAAPGEYLFALGDAESRHFAELAVGDYAQVTQTTDLTGVSLIRVNLALSVPASTPAGFVWKASIFVDSTRFASTSAAVGRGRAVTDLTANVSKLSGIHEVGVRLELLAS